MVGAPKDHTKLIELERALANLEESPHGPRIVQQVHEIVGADVVGRFSLDRLGERIQLTKIGTAVHVPMAYFRELESGLASGRAGFAFSTRIPERAQRNRSIVLPPANELRAAFRRYHGGRVVHPQQWGLSEQAFNALAPGIDGLCELLERYSLGNHFQLRTLICDGTVVLCYFNALQERAFTRRQRRLYDAVVELVARRARFDHRLSLDAATRATLDTALDALGRAAFVVDEVGRVHHANALGLEMIDSFENLDGIVSAAIRGLPSELESHPIVERGLPMRYLMIRGNNDLGSLCGVLAMELGLSKRAEQVLRCALDGEPTKAIATRLGIAENTVEYHLTNLFRRIGVRTRGELQRALLERLVAGNRGRVVG